ncbi:MAG: glycosyl hydrolase family 95 catalytic domain-containing protein [Janthinobacterium lividum]
MVLTNASGFRSYRDISGDAVAAARDTLDWAVKKSYAQLKGGHTADFGALFSPVQLQLGSGQPEHPVERTDERIHNFARTEDPGLLALYFEFGRYLLISSSRDGGQAANLQGIWNDQMTPPCSSKWASNINLQMNYWHADAGDLLETEQPPSALIGDLRQSGAVTAQTEYHANGWVLHHNTDLWRATAPVDGAWAYGRWARRGLPTRCGTTTCSPATRPSWRNKRIRR